MLVFPYPAGIFPRNSKRRSNVQAFNADKLSDKDCLIYRQALTRLCAFNALNFIIKRERYCHVLC